MNDSMNRNEDDPDLRGIPPFILDLQQTQPTLNIMTSGDVSHGKSTLLAALSGEATGKHSAEKKGNMTIRLGYTSCKIWKCLVCPRPRCFFSTHSDTKLKSVVCSHCGSKPNKSHKKYHDGSSKVLLMRHLSFVDVPGHAQLMQTMVSATSVADAAILVIDASKPCPGKQTSQHLDAMNLLGLMEEHRVIIAQNKVDLISPSKACLSFEEIRKYLGCFGDDGLAYNTPIIPISAQSKLNVDALCHAVIHSLPRYSCKLMTHRNGREHLHANVIRSFDVNKARDLQTVDDIDKMAGGVLGGAVMNGHLEIGQEIEIRPGYLRRKKTAKQRNALMDRLQPQWEAQPIRTTVKSLQYGKIRASSAYPGGNVGIQTNIDPSLTKSDGMCGHVIIDANHPNPPPIFNKFKMSYSFLCDAAIRQKPFRCNTKQFETIKVNIGSFKMKAEVVECGVGEYGGILCVLEAPICARVGDKVGICRQSKKKEWAFVAGGIIRETKTMKVATDRERATKSQSTATAKVSIGSQSMHSMENKEKEAVHINYQQRNGRKGVTTIVGLPSSLNFKKMVKKMKKEWSTGATIVEDEEKGTIIQIQGDLRHQIGPFIVKKQIVEASQVSVHGY